jgi:DNA mismatch endonuclease, patch repair protein
MTDWVDPLRSRIMRSVRQRGTNAEMAVRRALHAHGYRFRTNVRSMPGSPDVVFSMKRKAIFINGCFWHRHPGCKFATVPKTRASCWEAKFAANIERDARKLRELEVQGWSVATVWECETSDVVLLLERLRLFIGPRRQNAKRTRRHPTIVDCQ